eukprot:2812269-Alexandrium_andersonii.AAC.1
MILRQVPPATPVTGAPSLMIVTSDLEVAEGAPPPNLAVLHLVEAAKILPPVAPFITAWRMPFPEQRGQR